jgi:hypothetical protein
VTDHVSTFQGFGLTIASDIPLPELAPAGSGAAPDITIRAGATPSALTATEFAWIDTGDSRAVLLRFPEVGRFIVRDGAQIVYQREEGVADRDLRLHLLGSGMGTLLHQRGLLPLHGSAVCVDGRATLFVGHQRAGKSTLAARLAQRGYVVLNDDVSVVTFTGPLPGSQSGPGEVSLHPGTTHLKLWRDALDGLGHDPVALARVSGPFDKFFVPIDIRGQCAVAVREILVLSDADDGPEARIVPMPILEATSTLVQQTNRPEVVAALGLHERNFRQCVELARALPIARLLRPRGQQYFADTIDFLEAHWSRPPTPR